MSAWRSLVLIPALVGCASTYPDIVLDPDKYESASLETSPPLPVKIIEQPVPVAMPGQLKPREGEEKAAPALKPYERIERANKAAKIEPELGNYVNAVQVYPYMEGALYQLYAAPEQVTDIKLETGESLISVSAGDTVRWVVGDTESGAGEKTQTHILVKPIRHGLTTNLVIATDRRTYHVEMRSFRETYMAALSWTYPGDALHVRRNQNKAAKIAASRVIDKGLAVGAIKFRYAIEGDRPHWRPLRAFDDGAKVYIQFPENIGQGEAPPLFLLNKEGEGELVNYRVKGAFYIVDRLFAAAELRLGLKRQQVVRIVRTDLKRSRS